MSEAIIQKVRRPLAETKYEVIRALHSVSFDVAKGEVLGIIGRNGAGKSTLLKVLSRITDPTYGEVRLYGRVGSLLEVGTGFHPELTGRENIFLNGAILGMRRKEIEMELDAIVSFADVERFLDTPVKRYSSGMYVRLAFAVAAHLNPDILIIDEVLSVGDIQFQQKCLGRMKLASEQEGRTVLFVSHNMAAVSALCNRVLLVDSGKVAYNGEPSVGIAEYLSNNLSASNTTLPIRQGSISLTAVTVQSGSPQQSSMVRFSSPCEIEFCFEASSRTTLLVPKVSIYRDDGLHVVDLWGSEEGSDYQHFEGQWKLSLSTSQLMLLPATYRFDLSYYARGEGYKFKAECVLLLRILEEVLPSGARSYTSAHGVARPFQRFTITRLPTFDSSKTGSKADTT